MGNYTNKPKSVINNRHKFTVVYYYFKFASCSDFKVIVFFFFVLITTLWIKIILTIKIIFIEDLVCHRH